MNNNIQVMPKKANKKWYVTLAVAMAVLFIANIVLVTTAFFSDTARGSSVVTFGTIKTDAYIMENSTKSTTINLSANNLIAGAVTEKELHIDVIGTSDCYVRVTGEFQIAIDGSNYISASDLVGFSIDTTAATGWKLLDGKYYYTSVLSGTDSGSASKLTLPIKFTVSETFGNSNVSGTSVYKNKPYKVMVTVESCQAEGTSIGSGASFDHTKWVSN